MRSAKWRVQVSEKAIVSQRGKSFLHGGASPGLEIDFSGSENDIGTRSFDFAISLDHATDLGSFMIECAPKTKIESTIHVMRQQESRLIRTVIEEISFHVDNRDNREPGIIVHTLDGDFWLSVCSAREFGRVILSLARPSHRHISRPQVEKDAAVA